MFITIIDTFGLSSPVDPWSRSMHAILATQEVLAVSELHEFLIYLNME